MYEDKVGQLCSDYAAIAHIGQLRKDKITPYISHPGRVAVFTSSIGKLDFVSICASWLHDVMEDCAVGMFGDENYPFVIKNHTTRYRDVRLFLLDNPDINKTDGKKILELTLELTMSQDKSVPKKIRKEKYIDDISKGSVPAAIIKYCDRIDNLTTCHIFTPDGFKWYIKDTQMLIDKLSAKVKAVNYSVHLHLECKFESVKETYNKMYGK